MYSEMLKSVPTYVLRWTLRERELAPLLEELNEEGKQKLEEYMRVLLESPSNRIVLSEELGESLGKPATGSK